MQNKDDYTFFKYAVERVENDLKGCFYYGVFERPTPNIPVKISSESILTILQLITPSWRRDIYSFSFGWEKRPRLHNAIDVLTPVKPKDLPKLPEIPSTPEPSWMSDKYPNWYNTKIAELINKLETVKAEVDTRYIKDLETTTKIKEAYDTGDSSAIEMVAELAITRNPLPDELCLDVDTNYDCDARILLATIMVPDFKEIIICKDETYYNPKEVSIAQKKKLSEHILYALCIRAAYLVADTDSMHMIDTVAVNARQKWFDSATGAQREGIIASFQASKDELSSLMIEKIDPKVSFRHFSGIATPSIERVAPVRPIFIMDKNDNRHIDARDVDEYLEVDTNLAAMPWDDFEHLVRQLFEWEFGKNGVEVKVTCASRDRGVDAIMYDPDPLKGGKYVLQAKRYTRTVDVAAVRELYGTVVNEGANRGILVTTSGYGPDAYEFAKDKPISLVDGSALIQLLLKNDRKYRIDLEEARLLERSQLIK